MPWCRAWAHYPMVALSALATIIASQAVISGVFSITRQAVQLGQLPRMEIRHTSATERGQIYVPRINAMLCVGVVLIVLIFKSSDALARRLWHRGDRRDGDLHRAGGRGGDPSLALVSGQRSMPCSAFWA